MAPDEQQSCNNLLLLQFADGLQDWAAQTAAGAAAVATLERTFSELEASPPTKESKDVYKRLMELAPSFQLERYIQQQQQQPATTASDAASRSHAAITKLREATAAAHELLASLSDLSTQYQDAILSQQLTDTRLAHLSDPAAPLPSAWPGEGDPAAASPPVEEHTPHESESDAADAAALQPEELAILITSVVSGMRRDLEWMEAAVADISLGTSTEELHTLSTLWELQPFTNEAAVATLLSAAEVLAE